MHHSHWIELIYTIFQEGDIFSSISGKLKVYHSLMKVLSEVVHL